MSDDGVVKIGSKEYFTVARRIRDFRDKHPDYTITTKILSNADAVLIRAKVIDPTGRVLATGHAEEVRGATKILSTSCVETTETSAIGRCLSAFGLLGSDVAGAEELEIALEQQNALGVVDELIKHNEAVRDHIESVVAIKHYLCNDEYSLAYEAMAELPEEDKRALWRAPSKGGIFSTEERAQMKSNEWTAARMDYHGET